MLIIIYCIATYRGREHIEFVMSSLRLCNAMRPCLRSARLLNSFSFLQYNVCNKNPSCYGYIGRAVNHQTRPLGRVLSKRNLAVEAPIHDHVATLQRCGVNIDDADRRMLIITWANGETAAFHAVWLRHNCQCPSCVTSTNQKVIYPSILNPDMEIISTNVSGLLKTDTCI